MSTTEIFPNPTIKQVIFQIKFPNLFFIETKIGDFQLEIMEKFPETALALRQNIIFADYGNNIKQEDLLNLTNSEGSRKIWQFYSQDKKYNLNIQADSLDITSEFHKSYDNKKADTRFRDIIEFSVSKFISISRIPIINRIGLRYINECPINNLNSHDYLEQYNSAFNHEKFKLEDTQEMVYKTVIHNEDISIRYIESIQKTEEKNVLILDLDASSINIKSSEYLITSDKLHASIKELFLSTVKEPVIEYMRGNK